MPGLPHCLVSLFKPAGSNHLRKRDTTCLYLAGWVSQGQTCSTPCGCQCLLGGLGILSSCFAAAFACTKNQTSVLLLLFRPSLGPHVFHEVNISQDWAPSWAALDLLHTQEAGRRSRRTERHDSHGQRRREKEGRRKEKRREKVTHADPPTRLEDFSEGT